LDNPLREGLEDAERIGMFEELPDGLVNELMLKELDVVAVTLIPELPNETIGFDVDVVR
jgi:hypothetical protein